MSGPRGFQLSGTQVIASVLATLTGAIAASYLGVAGTLVGAAVGSIASTTGTEIYKHYLQRSQDRLRTAGQVLYHSAARTPTGNTMSQTAAGAGPGGRHAASSGMSSPPGADRDLADRETAVWDRRQYGATRDPRETQMIPGLATQWGGEPAGGAAHDGAAYSGAPDGGAPDGGAPNGGAPNGSGAPDGGTFPNGGASRGDDTASQHAHGDFTEDRPARDDAGRGGLWDATTSFFGGLTRRQWLTYGGTAAGFFLVVVAAITVFELTVGKPISAAVYGGHASGTSVGNMLGGHSPRHQKAPTHPASTSSATPAGSAPASPTSSGSSSGTPTPSTSVAPSSPSTLPSATPSTGSSGAARSTTTVTPTP